jgi:hypothetical protein
MYLIRGQWPRPEEESTSESTAVLWYSFYKAVLLTKEDLENEMQDRNPLVAKLEAENFGTRLAFNPPLYGMLTGMRRSS